MLFIFKFTLYFIISFVILSINVKNETLFIHLTKVAHPYTGFILEKSFLSGQETLNQTKSFFSNLSKEKE